MKILVISDNHGDETILEEVLSIHEDDIDSYIHCGDSELTGLHPLWQQYTVVKGNTDYAKDLKNEQVDKVNGDSFFVTHGHLYNVKASRQPIVDAAKAENSRFAFYGHTHIPKVEEIDGVYAINPGSISQPRGEFPQGTYCIVTYSDDVKRVDYYSRNHTHVSELSQDL